MLDEAFIYPQPHGVALIIGPWNYPVFCSLAPMVGAIAAGNCVILKPSEIAHSTAACLTRLISQYLDQECYQVINGGPDETALLLNEKFDYIFFTGSHVVGKVIYEAAAKSLTPLTLELGGKCPVYINDDVKDMEIVAKRILWGKVFNAGQTCVAPDYILCSASTQDRFVAIARKVLLEFFGSNNNNNKDYGRIINEKHFSRLQHLLTETKGRIAIGGNMDSSTRFIEPTVVTDVTLNDSLMQEEIFGPILPIIVIRDCEEAMEFLQKVSEPLFIYLFSENRQLIDKFIKETASGSVLVNDTIISLSVETLPFGGKGSSGLGRYFGKFSFDTFSHQKSVVIRNFNPLNEAVSAVRYPPYTEENMKFMTMALRKPKGYLPENVTAILPKLLSIIINVSFDLVKKVSFNAI
ncbi:Aldehyde dehydrogenase: dimeric NADP-preferring-like protein [Dinothrombium tinctorium]|uniref:Aldehyde dehydrogenase n=1 Tax=Dinothrombium tinctorium TaxID=1965070 RepID=A0A3S3PP94_9ACAR|nr:Aldehyde dehydrogenase: dimeric NADP-preferring-like protein [Dinothrombium tinctorium]